MKVLIVDDASPIRKIIGRMLTSMHLDYVEATHGKEAMTQLNTHEDIRLILLDWHMPVMDGMALLKWMKTAGLSVRPKVIMVTTVNTENKIESAMELGVDEYVMKPFTKEILEEKIMSLGFSGDKNVQ